MIVQSKTTISATPDQIWAVLTDPAQLVNDTGILRLDGAIAPGSALKLWSEASPKQAFKLKVTTLDHLRLMVWQGGMPLGLFTGTRRFELTPRGAQTELHVSESFRGPMSGLITRSMPDLQPSMDKFTRRIKALCEEAPA